MSQKDLANAIGVGARSISRYEGGYEPGPKVLKSLAGLAEVKGLDYLRDIFAAKMRGDIIAQVERLPSAGSARRVPIRELRRWEDAQKKIIREDSLDECKHLAYTVLNEISPYTTHIPTPAEMNERNRKDWDSQTAPEVESRQTVPAPKRRTKDAKKAR